MPLTDTLLSMKEFILAPLINPELFNQWLNNTDYAYEVKKFSRELSNLFDYLDHVERKQAQFETYIKKINKQKKIDAALQALKLGKDAQGEPKAVSNPSSPHKINKSNEKPLSFPTGEFPGGQLQREPNKSEARKERIVPRATYVTKSRKEKWIDCLLGEEVTDNLRVHGFIRDDINGIRRFLINKSNVLIQEYLENNLFKLSKAAGSCERYLGTFIDFKIPLADAVREIAKAKELLIEYPKVRDKLKDEMIESAAIKETKELSEQGKSTFILNLCMSDAKIHRNASQLLLSPRDIHKITTAEAITDMNGVASTKISVESIKIPLSSFPHKVKNVRHATKTVPSKILAVAEKNTLPPLSLKVQNELRAAHLARDKKRDFFPISCTHRMAKILARQLYTKIVEHLEQIFDIYQFLVTCKYVEYSKTLNIFYIYMLVLLAKNKNHHYLSKTCTMLDASLRQLIDEYQLESEANIIPFFLNHSRIKTYWQTILDAINKLNVALKPKMLCDLQYKIYLLLNPHAIRTKVDQSILNGSYSTEVVTPSPPLDDDTFHIQENNNDVDLLHKMEEEGEIARFMSRSQRAKSDNAIARKRYGLFPNGPTKLSRLDTTPIASRSRIAIQNDNVTGADHALLPPPIPKK